MQNILVMNIATNKYVQFLEKLYSGIRSNFLTEHEVSFLLFTNHKNLELSEDVKISHIEHKPFPEPTLKRYNYFMQERDYIEQFDYVFYSDVDMSFVAPVGEEVFGDLCLTKHLHCYETRNPDYYPYERNPNSTAYVPYGSGTNYYAGGFNGGKSKTFMKMSEVISENVLKDESNGITAVWHDESHMNAYAEQNQPDKILPIEYCCPEWPGLIALLRDKPRILALDKNHKEIRS